MRVVGDEFLHRARAVIRDLQKDRPATSRNSRQRADDQVVDETPQVVRARAAAGVGIENLQKMLEILRFRFDAELLVRLERCVVEVDVVIWRDGVETQLRAEFSFALAWIDLA